MRVRIHQHVNPLSPFFNFVSEPLDFAKIFTNPNLPLHIDIGCGRGRFLLKMAETFPKQNFLGLEIRQPLVAEANEIAQEKGLKNIHYEFTNAMLSLDNLLKNIPLDVLQMISIQFPDPWYKKRHAKRRMVKDELVEAVGKYLNGKVLIQTDVEFLADEMFDLFRQNESLREIEVKENPFPHQTEREISVLKRNLPVYRAMFEKVK
jgi:tRNA (guanine-N7-)-methyltransferase